MSKNPGIGDALPDIAMETPEGGTVRPSDFKGRKLVLFFYPKDDTPGCTTENKDFTELAGEFDKAGVALLGVSKDWPRTGLTIGLAVLLELGSVVLVILAVGPALRIQPDREMPCDVEACHEGTPATVPLQTDRSYWRRQRSKSIVAPDTAVIGRGPHHGT